MIEAFHQRVVTQGTRLLTLAPLSRRWRGSKTVLYGGGPITFKNQDTSDVDFRAEKCAPCLFLSHFIKSCLFLPVIVDPQRHL